MAFAVDCWVDGVRIGSGRPYSGLTFRQRGQLMAVLTEQFKAAGSPGGSVDEWARAKGQAWAKQGGDLYLQRFITWLNSGAEERPSGVRRAGAPVQPAGGSYKVGDGK
jgi:hypothetical protein